MTDSMLLKQLSLSLYLLWNQVVRRGYAMPSTDEASAVMRRC